MQARLNGKKGLILVALLMASLLGAYAVGYYTWTASYTVKPMVIDGIDITIPPTSGCTSGGYSETETDALLNTPKDIELYFRILVPSAAVTALERDFYSLSFEFEVEGLTTCTLTLVDAGSVPIDVGIPGYAEGYIGVPAGHAPPEKGIEVTVTYKTGNVITTGTYTLSINIYAVES